jgi:GT2 family glycosyltransferase
MNLPFTAARARNEGANYLLHKFPDLNAIQFIDGDCEVQADWISKAQDFLEAKTEYAVVCGRRRERFPEQSIYNQLCDIEWNTPVGDAMACGGDALIRVSAFIQVDGYKNCLIAGEEPEMCFRLRAQGWKIYRLDEEMVLHDAAITQFSQWWKRTTRTGYAFASGSSIHGKSVERYWVKETERIILWGLLLPIVIVALSIINLLYLALLLIYFVQIVRVGLKRSGLSKIKFKWAASIVLGKIPEALGLLKYYLIRNTIAIIEYK